MRRTHALVALLFLALSVAMTWPLAFGLDRLVAFPGDPYINTWILDWDWHSTIHHPFTLFKANIFHPAKDSLAFSEHLYGVALLLFPLRALGAGPLAAHNVAMLLGFAFSGFAMYLLGQRVSGSVWGGIAAGIFYAFAPWRFTQLPHVQHIWAGWLPMMLVALLWYAARPSWFRASMFGLAFLMNGLSNVHWFLFGTVMIVVTIPIVVRDRRGITRLAAAMAVALVLLLPFLLPYARVAKLYDMKRSWQEVKAWSATPRDWLNPGAMNRVYRRWLDPNVDAERWLFPGILAIAFGGLGASVTAVKGMGHGAWGMRGTGDSSHAADPVRHASLIAIVWLGAGFVGSLGVHTFFYRFLFAYAPGFRAIRVPARWANISYIGLAILVALGVAWLSRNRRWVGAVASILFVLELRAAPIRWWPATPEVPPVYSWIAKQYVRIAELPIDVPDAEYRYMLWATAHHRPTVNGISGFAPPEFKRLSSLWHSDPVSDDLVVDLRRLGVNLVVFHADYCGAREREWLRRELARGRLAYAGRFDHGMSGDWVFELRSGRSSAPELEAMLAGGVTPSTSSVGLLDTPKPGERITQPLWVSGWALSPFGIRKVDLLFNSGQVRYPTDLIEDKQLTAQMPWYPQTPKPRFIALFNKRPANVRPDTDIQIEITDGRGVRTRPEGRWIDWVK